MAVAFAAGVGAWVGCTPGWWAAAGSIVVPVGMAVVLVTVGGWRAVGLGLCLCVGVAGLAGVLAQRSIGGLVPPAEGHVRAEMTLVSDPAPLPRGGVRAEARFRGKRVAVIAFGSAATALDDRLAGEIVVIDGTLRPPGTFEQRMRHRHLAGRLEVDFVMGWRPGHGVLNAANELRRTLERGAESLRPRERSLFLGLVIGDDRFQPADLTLAFRAAGLSHMTAVSGQNVSFVLAAAAPVLRRLRLAPRLLVTLGLLAAFAVVTRGEPSVLRATGMAAVAAYGAAVGRPTSGLRALATAVTVLLLCDPLLVTSLGFRLSVAGAAGILVGARPIQRVLPGPLWLRTPLSVTLAAQLAVAPLLIAAFGSVTGASVLTNLLVAPAAGPVMAWGLVAGLLAGMLGGRAAVLLHLPTRTLLAWIERVAVAGARWPLGRIGGRELGFVVVLAAAALLVRSSSLRRQENCREPAPTGP